MTPFGFHWPFKGPPLFVNQLRQMQIQHLFLDLNTFHPVGIHLQGKLVVSISLHTRAACGRPVAGAVPSSVQALDCGRLVAPHSSAQAPPHPCWKHFPLDLPTTVSLRTCIYRIVKIGRPAGVVCVGHSHPHWVDFWVPLKLLFSASLPPVRLKSGSFCPWCKKGLV